MLLLLLCVPFCLCFLRLSRLANRGLGIINTVGYGLVLAAGAAVCARVLSSGAFSVGAVFYVDSLSALFLLLISLVAFFASFFSIGYMGEEERHGKFTPRKIRNYYFLFNVFCLTMLLVPMLRNLGFLWVAVEMTTLVSAFLVGFKNDKEAVEAAWKYLIVCSVGITFALLGTIFYYYAASNLGIISLDWLKLREAATAFDPRIIGIGFLFILVGYGTKAGLVPMHTWLPDAHSQAPSPISALLSGVLLKTAIYVLLRFSMITSACMGPAYAAKLFLFFGVLSVGISAGFILLQKDIKRLFAYSSVEHIGLIFTGIGIGGAGLYAGLLHVLNHAMTKSLAFFTSGTIARTFGTNNLHVIHGSGRVLPWASAALFTAVFALAGSIPFSIFYSELMILLSCFSAGHYWLLALLLAFLSVAFAAFVTKISMSVTGKKPETVEAEREPFSMKLVYCLLIGLMLAAGIRIAPFMDLLLRQSGAIISGGIHG